MSNKDLINENKKVQQNANKLRIKFEDFFDKEITTVAKTNADILALWMSLLTMTSCVGVTLLKSGCLTKQGSQSTQKIIDTIQQQTKLNK